MADVKWIKIVVDVFDDEKILLIESMPEADSIIVIWFKLLCLAGKQNNSGVFVMSNGIPYTETMLATIFRRKETVVSLALRTFEQFGMIEIVEGTVTIPKWGKHQSLDKIEAKNEYQRHYMRDYRAKQKLLAEGKDSRSNCKTNSKANVSLLEEERELELEEEKDIYILSEGNGSGEPKSEKIPYKDIVDLFNHLCPALPKVKVLSDTRRKAIRARFNDGYTFADFETLFNLAQSSPFLTGQVNNFRASFDWLITPKYMPRVLEGNYSENMDSSHGADKPQGKVWKSLD